jgi:hypothetical protein
MESLHLVRDCVIRSDVAGYVAGELVRASIQPDGDVSTFTGEIDNDHRIVFVTNGCGAWSAE